MLTVSRIWVRHDRMLRSAKSASTRRASTRRAGIGLLLALPAIVGQLLIAGPHEAERAAAACAASAHESGTTAIAAPDATHASRTHDPAQCPSCQAATQGRNALGGISIGQALPLPPRSSVIWIASADVPGALARSSTAPRAPPA
jgi:hypothetical protein